VVIEEHEVTESADGLEVDLLVVGAGMAGMSAAGYAVQHGLSVGVVERAPRPGGSALLSGGFCWAPDDLDTANRQNPHGSPELTAVLVNDYARAVGWVESLGVDVSPEVVARVNTFPSHGRVIDILSFLRRMQSLLEDSGGWLVTGADVDDLIVEGGRVRGARVRDRDGSVTVRSRWTLLASGGFQNSTALRRDYLDVSHDDVIIRSNQYSEGRGLQLALSVGAALSPHMNSFYGHLMAAPLTQPVKASDYVRLAQLYSPRGVLFNRSGERFCDESLSYHHNGRAVARLDEGRALLVGDDTVLAVDRSGYGGATELVDRIADARDAGARVAVAATFSELSKHVMTWGYSEIGPALERFNADMAGSGGDGSPPRKNARRPLNMPPYFAVEVQPAITFTMGGPLIDARARVLNANREPIDGLLAAGADAGGLYHEAYLGGISMGLTFGRRAAATAAGLDAVT
jgi:succinate dehydrogenase/fumarate reductase flavoprotein subunit